MNFKKLEKLMTSLLMVNLMEMIGKNSEKKEEKISPEEELIKTINTYTTPREDKLLLTPKKIKDNEKMILLQQTEALLKSSEAKKSIEDNQLKEKAAQADRETSDKRAMLELNRNGK